MDTGALWTIILVLVVLAVVLVVTLALLTLCPVLVVLMEAMADLMGAATSPVMVKAHQRDVRGTPFYTLAEAVVALLMALQVVLAAMVEAALVALPTLTLEMD